VVERGPGPEGVHGQRGSGRGREQDLRARPGRRRGVVVDGRVSHRQGHGRADRRALHLGRDTRPGVPHGRESAARPPLRGRGLLRPRGGD
ncbi:MAG: hypothetical protein AVDCRST_MAG58-4096, partial [uncultured Rubrobacteraceae bacterium]